MSTTVEMNGLSLIPIKDAASRVSYSRDYVARLAREGKIVASQIGRQWFVDLTSLQNFSAEATALEEVRRQDLRAERRRELMAKESLGALDEVVARRVATQRFDAAVITAAVVCLGLFIGVGSYTAATIPGSPLEDFSRALAVVSVPVRTQVSQSSGAEVVLPPAKEEHSTLLMSTVVEQPVFATESETALLEGGLAGVVVLTPGSDVPDEATVAGMFSDEVAVEFVNSTAGTISYDNGSEVKVYPFVRVPNVEEKPKTRTP